MPTIQPPEVPAQARHADKPADEVALPRIRFAALLGMLGTAALLGVLSATAGLGVAGWIAGLATGWAATALLVTARRHSDQPAILPADWVTLTRLLLIAGVTGLVADSFSRPVSITALVTLSAAALALDAVDGQVARRTGTATPTGALIDGDADAFLHPGAQHRRVPGLRRLGAGHRRRPLRVPAGRLADPVAARHRCPPGSGARSWPRSRASCSPWPHPE